MTNTQKMNNSEKSTQNFPNLHVYSSDESESKIIDADENKLYAYSTEESESKSVIVNTCSLDKSKSKSVHISVNMSKVDNENNDSFNTSELKYAKNKKRINNLWLRKIQSIMRRTIFNYSSAVEHY